MNLKENEAMRKRSITAILMLLLLTPVIALAGWTSDTEHLSYYEDIYGEASEQYKTIKYGASGQNIVAIKETLASLGFFPYRASENYYRTLQAAIQAFCQQLRIGGDGQEITPLMQAILADSKNLPKAISPAIDIYAYSWESDSTQYISYTYARIMRSSVRTDTKVGFSGKLVSVVESGGVQHCVVEMENDPEKRVYVTYQPLARTTVFQPGDEIAVFGVTQNLQTLSYEGMDEEHLMVAADRVGYAK